MNLYDDMSLYKSYEAYESAKINGHSEERREAACETAYYAYYYAYDIDKCARDDTRKAACKESRWAYYYARDIDKGPREDTREVACKDPEDAYWYAEDVDKCFHKDTWAVVKDTKYEKKYKTFLNNQIKKEII